MSLAIEQLEAGTAQLLQQMQSVRLFAGLDSDALQVVLGCAQLLDVPAGTELAREGGDEHEFYVLLQGELVVMQALGQGLAPLEVGSVRPGSSFGELGALLGERRTASVAASRASRLLRLNAAGLQTLFDRCPGFGWAFSRELAQGLKAALAVKNELQAEHGPETVVLDVPAIDRLREYTAAYYASALRTLVRQHKLIVDRQFPHYEATLRITAEARARWNALFGVPQGAAPPPFSFHSTVGTLTVMKVVADVGVNFRNLLHLRSEMALSLRDVEPGADYRLRARLTDIQVLRGDRVVLVVDSRLNDADGHLVRSFRDFFVILKLEPHQIEALSASQRFGRLDVAELRDAVRRKSKLTGRTGVLRSTVQVPEDMGTRYGQLSGDMNPVHTTALAARLFGYPRPFVQGLFTANQVLALLTAQSADRLQLFRIAFTQPVLTGSRVEVLTAAGEYEVLDGDGKVLAFGNFSRAPTDCGRIQEGSAIR